MPSYNITCRKICQHITTLCNLTSVQKTVLKKLTTLTVFKIITEHISNPSSYAVCAIQQGKKIFHPDYTQEKCVGWEGNTQIVKCHKSLV